MPRLSILFLSLILSLSSVVAETVYKKVKPDGSVEFTDRDSKGSKKIKLRKTLTYPAPRLPAINLQAKKKKSQSYLYGQISIIRPTAGESIQGASGTVKISISLNRSLATSEGHKVKYMLSGESKTSESLNEVFENVSRGTQILSVVIVSGKGAEISPTSSMNLYIKRNSKLFKKKNNNSNNKKGAVR